MRRLVGVFFAMLLLGLSALALDVTTPRGVIRLKETSGSTVSLKELASALNGTSGIDSVSKYPFIVISGKRIVFSTTSGMASIDGSLVRFRGKPREVRGDILIPVSALEPVLTRALEGEVTVGKSSSAGSKAVESPKPISGQDISMGVAVGFDNVRLTLTGKGVRQSKVSRSGKRVDIELSGAKLEEHSRNLGKGIVETLLVREDGSGLEVVLGDKFTSMSRFTLLNPERLVVIFKGSGQEVGVKVNTPPGIGKSPNHPSSFARVEKVPQRTPALDVVVIDPGHGGADSGAVGRGALLEKNITLSIAEKLKSKLENHGIKTILTRNEDTLVPLVQRTALANYNRADLFISIHVNAAPQKSAKGAEVYFMSSEATDQWSKMLASKENSSGISSSSGKGVNLVLWNLAQTAHMVESSVFAEMVQEKLNSLLGTGRMGVRQAPFVVLEGAEMPAILVEVAFITNPGEKAKLSDKEFLDKVADVMTEAVLSYKARYERRDVKAN